MFVLRVEDEIMGCGEPMLTVDEKFWVEQQSELRVQYSDCS